MDLAFQVPMQYCSLQHQILLLPPDTSTAGHRFHFGLAVYCHPAYLTYMQNTSCKMLGWMKYKLESRLLGEISVISDMQMTPH